jgi:prepilin-type N-terminal cleavage/methylation domain-containing protein/prepilin-type processing-associated H-X9-DG protein
MNSRPRGFTLVELLVVIAIIGILVALLLPAIQSAREAARRSQCINNLKQLGVAFQNYHDTHKQLPLGNHSCCWGTWQMSILPFIEEQQLGDLYQFLPKNATFHEPAYGYDRRDLSKNPPIRNLDVTTTRIPTLTCPSDEPQINTTQVPGEALTFHNYVANYGNTNHIGADHKCPPNPASPGGPACVRYRGSPFTGNDWDLIVPDEDITKFKEIADGLSKTLMASETVQGRDGDLRGFTWWGWSAGFESMINPNASDTDRLYGAQYCKDEIVPNPPCDPATPGDLYMAAARSRHPGGVNAVMCDSSVQFIVNDVDLATWRAASTIKGEEVYSGLIP